jgi:transcriptional regulator GlxA family with amidase domain
MRLERAKAWIEEGARDLAAVAARAGFSSHAHFTTAFHKAFGLTPSEHRRRIAQTQAA